MQASLAEIVSLFAHSPQTLKNLVRKLFLSFGQLQKPCIPWAWLYVWLQQQALFRLILPPMGATAATKGGTASNISLDTEVRNIQMYVVLVLQ